MNDFSKFYLKRLECLNNAFAHQHVGTLCQTCKSLLKARKELFEAFALPYNAITKNCNHLGEINQISVGYDLDPLIRSFYENLPNDLKNTIFENKKIYEIFLKGKSEDTGIPIFIMKDYFEYRSKMVKIS